MNVLPTQEEVRRIASTGKYKVIPVSCEILSDFTTPIETLKMYLCAVICWNLHMQMKQGDVTRFSVLIPLWRYVVRTER